MGAIGEFDEPRLVAACDTLNGYAPGPQLDFSPRLAHDLDARTPAWEEWTPEG